MKVDNAISVFENEYMKLWIKDNILHCMYSPFLVITLDVAKICVEDRIKFTRDKSYPLMTDMRRIKFIDRKARIYLAQESSLKNISAEALIIGSQSEKFLLNLYININTPQIPTKRFSNEEEATKWLEKFNKN